MATFRILVVEDNPDDEFLTLKALKKSQIQSDIVVVRDGAEAIEYLDKSDQLPSLVFLDFHLPKVDGAGVLQHIRSLERTKLLPVIVFSSSKEEMDLKKCYISGANSYVVKPIDRKEYTDKIQKIESYWLVLNERAPQNS